MSLIALWLVAAPPDVTSEAGRRMTLLEYVASRDDLGKSERARWDKALRRVFGGKAIKDGSDEGVTSAKSVIAAAIFFGVDPEAAARAAYDAYHDTYRWVPPPIAVQYQLMKLQGRAPKASPRELAWDFERYYDAEVAPEIVAWWEEMLAKGAIAQDEVAGITRVLEATRDRMRPLLLERLWRGAELEARRRDAETERELARLGKELQRGFANVGRDPAARSGAYRTRYTALARELKVQPKELPRPAEPPRVEERAPKPDERGPKPDGRAPKPEGRTPKPEGRDTRPSEPASPSDAPASGPLGVIADIARKLRDAVAPWLGTPYLFGGVDRKGIDCSAFVRAVVAASMGIELPRNSRAQYDMGRDVRQSELSAGDLVFFDTMDRGAVSHVGIYVGGGQFAHASSTKGVTLADLAAKYYQRAFWGARRL